MRRLVVGAVLALLLVGGVGCSSTPTRVLGEQATRGTTPTTGTIRGIVHDTGGQPHPNAHLSLVGLGVNVSAVSGPGGNYEFANLAPGTYVLTVVASELTPPTSGAVYIGPSERSSRKEVTVRLGVNIIDAESGF